jgi:single-stranded DNA-binding protein
MSYEVTGKLVAVYDTMQRTETFKVREFVIEKQDDIGGRIISNFIKFQCVQDKTEMPGRFNVGDEVKVSFNLKGNRSDRNGQTTYFTNLDAWRMENAGAMQQGGGNGQQSSGNQQGSSKSAQQKNNVDDDLPEVPDDLPF